MLERPASFEYDLISEVGEGAVAGFRSQEAAHLDYPPAYRVCRQSEAS